MKIKAIFTAALALAAPASAFWRMECRERVALGRMDPLISPGEASQHAHTIHGSSGFGETTDYEQLMAGNCTSCAVKQDHSAYWTPVLYFQNNETGDFTIVPQVGGMLAYYFLNSNPGEDNVTAFPEGFRMIAGDNFRRNYSSALGNVDVPDPGQSIWGELGQETQLDLEERALGFNCLNYQRAGEGSLYRHFLPDKEFIDANCADGVRFELMFPSCWNGQDVDTVNHKDHMAYPDLVMTGACPDDFPVRLVSLFYETIWDTTQFINETGQFVIANGDPTGFGYHGDFMMGWNETFLQQAVAECTNLSGMIQDCPLFDVDYVTPQTCSITPQANIAKENVTGPGLTELPGNVAIQWGPAPASMGPAVSGPVTTQSMPSLSYKPGTTASVNGSYVPGDVFDVPQTTSLAVTAAPSPEMQDVGAVTSTTTTTTSTMVTDAVSAVSTQYVTVGNIVSEIVWEEAIVYVTQMEGTTTITQTATATSTVATGGSNARRDENGGHLHHHRARHHDHGY